VTLHDFAGADGVAGHHGIGDLDVFLADALAVLLGVLLALQADLAVPVGLVPQALKDSGGLSPKARGRRREVPPSSSLPSPLSGRAAAPLSR
jgi:hypothetical protein